MKFELPQLPYSKDALEPYITRETLEYHHGKHHQAYVNNLNNLIAWSEFENMELEEIIKKSSWWIFNNAAQVWNHTFYWNCLSPNWGEKPTWKLLEKINSSFWSFEEFKEKFSSAAVSNFWSGWTWLVEKNDWSLEIVSTSNAATPLTWSDKILLTIDVWEHAYYIDYRNARPSYVEKFWNIVNWDFVNSRL